ncbi:hypothetical protein Lepto782_02470 [Leptospira interrogans serovar Canicola]|uniref:Uncharacterized protein n=1 Tax=Leptospira interrogans serovar Canicola TaxID=211880 RepID=A0AAQ0AW90_LEPIR|nr:hypothetical protein LeptoLang_02395 [Leptospira interrogans serovar Icterohaemorrhagiae]QOI41272.1 hypothetical protein Lepto782_02470 [Leptospira interrogans serovar Canicola]
MNTTDSIVINFYFINFSSSYILGIDPQSSDPNFFRKMNHGFLTSNSRSISSQYFLHRNRTL